MKKEVMKLKKVLFAIIMLSLTLTLLPTASVVAPGPKPKEKAEVAVLGIISTVDPVTLDIRRAGRLVIVYGSADLVGTLWDEFQDGRQLGIRIDKSGETEIIYTFGTSDFEDRGWSKYELTGSGTFSSGNIPYGTVFVTGEPFTIYETVYERKGKKGAIGVTYNPVWDGPLWFTIIIEEA